MGTFGYAMMTVALSLSVILVLVFFLFKKKKKKKKTPFFFKRGVFFLDSFFYFSC